MAGRHGHGATIAVNLTPTAATNATTIGLITSISGPNQTKNPIDVSSMDSANKAREKIGGMLDAGELTFELNYEGVTAAQTLETLLGNTAQWNIGINEGTNSATSSQYLVNGFITSLGHAIPFDDKISQSVTVKLSGEPTFSDIA